MRHRGHFFRILLTAVLLLGLLPLNIWAAEGQSAGEATVLFTHDLHSCFFPRVQEGGEERGGFARLAAALAAEREAFKASVDKAGREIEAKYA